MSMSDIPEGCVNVHNAGSIVDRPLLNTKWMLPNSTIVLSIRQMLLHSSIIRFPLNSGVSSPNLHEYGIADESTTSISFSRQCKPLFSRLFHTSIGNWNKYYTGSLFLICSINVSRARAALWVVLCTVYWPVSSRVPPLKFPSPYLPSSDGPPVLLLYLAPLPLSVAPSLLRSLPPSPLPLAPSMHSSVPSSLVPFLNPPSLPILPLSPYIASLLPHSIPLLLPSPPSPCSLTTIRRPSSLLPIV